MVHVYFPECLIIISHTSRKQHEFPENKRNISIPLKPSIVTLYELDPKMARADDTVARAQRRVNPGAWESAELANSVKPA